MRGRYIFQQLIINLRTGVIEHAADLPRDEIRGSYRSVAVTSGWEHVLPTTKEAGATDGEAGGVRAAESMAFSRPKGEEGDGQVVAPHGDVYVFSNSNFTDVHRELHALDIIPSSYTSSGSNDATNNGTSGVSTVQTTDLTSHLGTTQSSLGTATPQPPGLRFPFAAQIGHYLVVGGTYLSSSSQQFALWALDLRSWTWEKVDVEVLEGNGERVVRERELAETGRGLPEGALAGGSWNRAVHWEDEGRLVVFGNRYRSLQEDCEYFLFRECVGWTTAVEGWIMRRCDENVLSVQGAGYDGVPNMGRC